jgi:uncharacterized protein YbjQ (UPF0145 family)
MTGITKYWPVGLAVIIFMVAAVLILGPIDVTQAQTTRAQSTQIDTKSGMIEYRTTVPGVSTVQSETYHWADGGKLRAVNGEQISGGRVMRVGLIIARDATYSINYDQSFAVKVGTGSDALFAMRDANATMLATMRNSAKKVGTDTVAGVPCDVYKTDTTEACIIDNILLRATAEMPGGKFVKIAATAKMGGKIDPSVFAPPPGIPVIDEPRGMAVIDLPR